MPSSNHKLERLVLLVFGYAVALTKGQSGEDLFHQLLADEFEAQGIRGAAYAFRGPGMEEPVLGAYGFTASSMDAPAVDVDTAFMLASVSKTFTGAAVAMMLDQGLIGSLDEDICNAVIQGGGQIGSACRNPDFPETPVTWRMLVTHRSSILRDVPSIDDNTTAVYGPTGVNYPIEVVGNPECPIEDVQGFFEDLMVDKETETIVGNDGFSVNWYDLAHETLGESGVWNSTYEPGEFNSYSNIAVGYIAALVEKVAGEPFADYCATNIFEKAGMNHTAWFRRDLPMTTLEAVPVYSFNNVSDTWEDVGHFCFPDFANGQLHSTIRDLATYADLILDNYGIDTLWSSDTALNNVFGCQEKDVNGDMLLDTDLGCEWSLSWGYLSNAKRDAMVAAGDAIPGAQLDWTNGVTHDGAEAGVSTNMLILPEAGLYAIILFNTDDADTQYNLVSVMDKGLDILVEGGDGVAGGNGDDTVDDEYYYDDAVDDEYYFDDDGSDASRLDEDEEEEETDAVPDEEEADAMPDGKLTAAPGSEEVSVPDDAEENGSPETSMDPVELDSISDNISAGFHEYGLNIIWVFASAILFGMF